MIKLLKNPWEETLTELIQNSKESITISSPFITKHASKILLKNITTKINVNILTTFKLAYFKNGGSSLEALDSLLRLGSIRNVSNLHSKVYVFDQDKAVVTSANFTYGGLVRNYEYGLLISNQKTVSSISADFEMLFHNEHKSTPIEKEMINQTKELVDSLPRIDLFDETRDSWEPTELLTQEDIGLVKEKLSPSEIDIIDILSKIKHRTISLKEIYTYKNLLQEKYPTNTEIEAKIRQLLQFLRDKGLIEFIDRGIYRKLW